MSDLSAQPAPIDRQGAFVLGYSVPIIGIHFNATDLLATAGEGASGQLQARIATQVASFEERKRGVVDNVRHVLALLQRTGLDAGPPPRFTSEYYPWAERIQTAWEARFSMGEHLELSAAELVGHLVGDALLTLNLGALVEHLLEVSPGHPFLTRQAEALCGEQSRLAPPIERATANPLVPAEARLPLAEFLSGFRGAPSIGEAGKAGTRGAGEGMQAVAGIQSAMRSCGQKLAVIEAAFAKS